MTQALNLGLLGNNVNTSGQVSLTAGVSGTLPVANGGTGATTLTSNNVLLGNGTSALQAVAPSTSGNVLTSNGSTWTSAALPVAVPSSVSAIGSILMVLNGTTSIYVPGNTIAGSSLYYPTNAYISGNLIYTEQNATGSSYIRVPGVGFTALLGIGVRSGQGNPGWVPPLNFATLSGTWRTLHVVTGRTYVYDGNYNEYGATANFTLAQRIA